MNNIYAFSNKVILFTFFFVASFSQITAQTLIPINVSQVSTDDNAETLFDGDLETHWNAGWDLDDYPAFAHVDLGGSYELSKIELYDFAGSGQFKVYAGSPGNWDYNAIAVDALENFGTWNTHHVNATTTHLLFRIKTPRSRVSEIRIYGVDTETEPEPPIDQEITFNAPDTVTLTEGTSETVSIQAINATELSTGILPDFINFNNLGSENGTLNIQPEEGDAGTYNLTLNATSQNGQTTSITMLVAVEVADDPGPGPTEGEETLCEIFASQLIFGKGDPGKLVDEQDALGDPANGPGANPLNFWFPGWKSRYYPAESYLDLGSTKTLTRIFLRDISGVGNFRIYAGVPGNWQSEPIVDDNLQAYLSWTEHTTPVATRYLKVVMENASSKVSELAIYGYCGEEVAADNIAPARVINLSASNVASQSVKLNWKASGDDGNTGTAATYDLRYSTSPISGFNFSSATVVATNAPQSAGTNETKTITGLDCNTFYYFAIRVIDETGNKSIVSNIINKTTEACINQDGKQITLTLNQTVDVIDITKSKLKYNKDFAYSFTVDDGSIWDYYITFPLISGGVSGFPPTNPETPWFEFPDDPHLQETGFSYSDGCGNEVKFKAGLSLNTELASDDITDYHITWDNIREIYNNDWDIFGHGHQHCNTDCDYNEEIQVNRNVLEDNLGFLPTHFVVPSGNSNYHQAAYDNGMVAVYDQSYQLPGFEGLQIDGPVDFNEFIMHRYPLETSAAPYGYDLDMIAGLSGDGDHYWMTEFAHSIGHPHGGEYYIRVAYNDFKTYMNYIENEYGKPWSDKKVWMAPMQEVYEYLRVRDAVDISTNNQDNTLTIFLDDEDVPSGLRRHALSLIVNLPEGVNITEVVSSGVTIESYNATTGLLNLKWD